MDVTRRRRFEAGRPLTIETVQLEWAPGRRSAGRDQGHRYCHTEQVHLSGADPEGLFPCILGTKVLGGRRCRAGVQVPEDGRSRDPALTPECREFANPCVAQNHLCTAISRHSGQRLDAGWQ